MKDFEHVAFSRLRNSARRIAFGLSLLPACVLLCGMGGVSKSPVLETDLARPNDPSMCDNLPPEVPASPNGCLNIVQNCGFETGDLTAWEQSGDLSYTGVSSGAAHSGDFGLFSGPITELGFITQTLVASPGELYTLTFWLRNIPNPPPPLNEFDVFWDGTLVSQIVNAESFPYMEFRIEGLPATSVFTPIQFGFYQPPSFFYFDDVVVAPLGCFDPAAD